MIYEQICKFLKGVIPLITEEFSIKYPINEIVINNGIVEVLGNFQIPVNTIITVTNSGLNYDAHGLSKEYINSSHTLTDINKFNITHTDLTLTLNPTNSYIHTNINISFVLNETLAYERFKLNPKDSIFIIPTTSKNKITDSNMSTYGNYVKLREEFLIIIYMHDKQDLGQFNNVNKIYEIRDLFIQSLVKFKPLYRTRNTKYSTITFMSSEFVIGTRNSSVLRSVFKFDNIIDTSSYDNDYGVKSNLLQPNPNNL